MMTPCPSRLTNTLLFNGKKDDLNEAIRLEYPNDYRIAHIACSDHETKETYLRNKTTFLTAT